MSRDRISDLLRWDNHRLWLLIAVCAATIFTLQAVEQAVEGAWPHERRPARLGPRGRTVHGIWPAVALLVLLGLLLGILNLVVLLWQDVPRTQTQVLGSVLVGLGWLIFILVSTDRLGLGRYMRDLGVVGPVALIALLLAGDGLLLIGLLDILPSWQKVRDALPLMLWPLD